MTVRLCPYGGAVPSSVSPSAAAPGSFRRAARHAAVPLLAAAFLCVAPGPAVAQTPATRAAIHGFLQNSLIKMQLDEESWLPVSTDTVEFLPAANLMPGGGILVTEDLAMSAMVGLAVEPWRWALHETAGIVTLQLIMGRKHADDPTIVLAGPVSAFDGTRARIELRGTVQFEEEPGRVVVEEIVVRATLIALTPLDHKAVQQQRASLAGGWTLQRIGDNVVAGPDMPAVTYTFAADSTFAVAAADAAPGAEAAAVLSMLDGGSLHGRWLTTAWTWTRPPMEAAVESGRILMLYRDAQQRTTPELFTILEQTADALVIKPFALWPHGQDLGWITLQLRRQAARPPT
jgi:hypothetical protein